MRRRDTRTHYVNASTGYAWVQAPRHPRADKRGLVLEHLVVAEKALGRYIEKPNCIHHVNGVRSDNRPQNLVICENAKYHHLLHARTRIIQAGGDPNTQKICWDCKAVKDKTEFTTDKTQFDGRSSRCNPCFAEYDRRHNVKTGRTQKMRGPNISSEATAEILRLIDAGATNTAIARQFGITKSAVVWIKRRSGRTVKVPGAQTHCNRGHRLVWLASGRKVCRPCRKESQRQYMERRG